jgi:hypothetical protein
MMRAATAGVGLVVLVSAFAGCTPYEMEMLGLRPGWIVSPDMRISSGDKWCTVRKEFVIITLFRNSDRLRDVLDSQYTATIGARTEYGMYPGRSFYALVDGTERWVDKESVSLTGARMERLKEADTLVIGWSPWPQGGLSEWQVSMEEFRDAVEKCEEHLLESE